MKIKLFFILSFLFCTSGYSQCWKKLESAANHTIAIHLDGTLWAWGSNSVNELGDGTSTNKNIPTLINSSTNWVSISAGDSHSLALKSDGTIWSWGYDVYGALGLGSITQINTPTQIGNSTNWIYIAAGDSISFAIKSDGTIWGWGLNLNGEVGDGTITPKLIPTKINNDTNWLKVFSGNGFNAAIKTNGTLWTWGSYNNFGELGNGSYSSAFIPTQIGTDSNWSLIATEFTFGLGLKSNGTIWAWGSNSSGQFGNGTTNNSLLPIQIGTENDWKYIESGNSNFFAIKNNGTLWSTGYNYSGMLGNNTINNSLILTQIGMEYNWKEVSSQLFQTIGLKTNNIGFGWGSNYFGQIGNGYFNNGAVTDTNNYYLPVQINCPCTQTTIPLFSVSENICYGTTPLNLPSISTNGIHGIWNPSIISNTTNDTYIFTPNLALHPCASITSINTNIIPNENIIFNNLPISICQNSTNETLPIISSNTIPISGTWSPSNINSNIIGQSIYTFTANQNQCVANTTFLHSITVNQTITPDFNNINPICEGLPPPVLDNTSPNGIIGNWSPNIINNSVSGNYTFTPTINGCKATQTLFISIIPKKVPDFENFTICKGDTNAILSLTSPNGIQGTWIPSIIDYNNSGSYIFTPNSNECATSKTIQININDFTMQDFSYTVTNNFSNNPTITVVSNSNGNYLYSLDNGVFQESQIFENILGGEHFLTIIDIDNCNKTYVISNIQVFSFPNFFTPNGDGFNDYWNIIGNTHLVNMKIYLFDRFGKFLKQTNPQNQGWDGNYNGRPLPSSDYWFKIEYIENGINKQFYSHFTLKR